MLYLFIAAALIAAWVLSRLPWWFSATLVAIGVLLTASLVASAGLEQAAVPALMYTLVLGLLVPVNDYPMRSSRVAPARRRRAKADTASPKGDASRGPGLDSSDVPGYEVLEKVGSGGMASVYRARRKSDGRVVALKIPMEQYVADAKFIRRFHREAEVAQRLDHVNIVRTFEHGSMGVKHYMAMEFVDGRSLESYIESNELSTELSVEIMKLVVGALQHIHSAGIIHRDIKPANIMILRGGVQRGENGELAVSPDTVKLMDFGIAGGKILSRLTMTGARVGTPVYMSPEQARGLKIDHRSDIYSLGLVFYEMLTGQTAFKGGYEAIVHQQIFQTPPPPRQLNLDIPKALDSLIMRMINKEPDERPSLEEVYEELGVELTGEAPEVDLPSRIIMSVNARQGILRILDTEGNLHTSLGELGAGDTRFAAAPQSIAMDCQGNFYLAIFEYRSGQDGHYMIHRLDPNGQPSLQFGTYGMKCGEFLYPASIAVSRDRTVYVLDSETHLVQRFDSEGAFLSSFGGRGKGRGEFNDPRHLLVDRQGRVYVLDYGNKQVQRFDAEGHYQTRWAFKMGPQDSEARLLDGVTVDDQQHVYISDGTGRKIRKISAEGKVVMSYAVDPLQGEVTDAVLDLAVDDLGYLYAARRGGHLIRKYDPSGRLEATIETYAPVVQMIIDVREVHAVY